MSSPVLPARRATPPRGAGSCARLPLLRSLALAAAAAACGGPNAGRELPRLLDLDGRPVALPSPDGAPVTVVLFTRTDCPISNRYAPEVRRLHARFAPRGVVFWLVYVDPDESPEVIRRHVDEYGYPFGALRDPSHELVARTGATVTPEAAVFVPGSDGPRLAYRGRIDDRYVDFGRARSAPSTRELDAALEALLEGRPVPSERTQAVGCFISDLS